MFNTALVAGAVLLGVLIAPLVAGQVYVRDDLGAFHLPLRQFYAQALAAGERFDWMPSLFGGFYVTGEGQLGGYHLLHLALYRLLPLEAAFAIETVLAYPLLMAGMYLLLARHVRRRGAALAGALVYAASSFHLLHLVHVNAVLILAHLPWLLLAGDVAVRSDTSPRGTVWSRLAVALLTASMLLLGYPQYVWFALLAQGAYVAWLCGGGAGSRRRAAWWAVSIALGALMAGIQVLPTWDALAGSTRHSATADFRDLGSLHPANLIQLVAPWALQTRVIGQNTHELGLYQGAVPLALVVWLVAAGGCARRDRRLAWAAAVLAIAATALALGRYGPIYRWQAWLPVVGGFRFPCRYLCLVPLATAALTAIALVRLSAHSAAARHARSSRLAPATRELQSTEHAPSMGRDLPQRSAPRSRPCDRQRRGDRALVGLVAAAVLAMVALAGLVPSQHLAHPLGLLAGPLLMTAAAGLIALATRGVPLALPLLVALAAADLGVYGLSYSVWGQHARLDEYIASLDQPPSPPPARIIAQPQPSRPGDPRTGNALLLAGWHLVDGYAGLEPARALDLADPDAWRRAGVRWVRQANRAASGDGGGDGERDCERGANLAATWRAVDDPWPRFRFDAEPTSAGHSVALQAAPPARAGEVVVLADRPGRMLLEIDATSRGRLTFQERYHPGWRAWLDDEPQRVEPADGEFLSCSVPAGKHRLRIEFRPASLRRGALVSLSGLGLTMACCALGWLRSRRHSEALRPDSE